MDNIPQGYNEDGEFKGFGEHIQKVEEIPLFEDSSYFTKTKNTEDLWGEMTNEELER